MSSTFVTLAEVLEARGGPLVEDEVWSLLLGTAESLVDVSYKGHNSMSTIISPSSLLLSATGTLAFKNCALTDEVTTFTAPEMLQGRASSTKPAMEKMLVYSLGMTLYWSVDYHLPQNQPVPLSDHLNSLLLSMCEDLTHRRVNLNSILEACESQHKTSLLPPPNKVISQLVEDVFQDSTEHGSQPESIVHLSGRSQMIRERLHGKRGPYPDYGEGSGSGVEARRYSEDSYKSGNSPHRAGRPRPRSSPPPSYHNTDRLPRGLQHRDSSSSSLYRTPYLDVPPKAAAPAATPRPHSPSLTFSESTHSLTKRKAKARGPEFIRMADEQQIILELPGSIVSKKGRSCVSQREVSVIMPNGQTVSVRCDIKSRGRDVFDMVVAHANLVEHFYFGLAFLDDDEYFFLDHETKISKVAPDSWKKIQSSSFLVHLRVKFFVDDISFILHRMTRHQYYLQLRKDILEDRLYCNEETGMFLAALALQAEFGDYMSEVYGKNYYQPEHYLSKRLLERMAFPTLREELPRLHLTHTQMAPEAAEKEYLKIAQQLPEYGVVFHRVGREKKPVVGELVLGVCAKGLIVYEVKNHLRVVTRRFLWRETDSISTGRRKLTIECGPSGKKHSFVTESSKIAQYLLSLCSSQHKFHSEMTSRQQNHNLAQDENMEKYMSICRSRDTDLKRMSCSEGGINLVGLAAGATDAISKSCDDLSAKMEARLHQQRKLRERNLEMLDPQEHRDLEEQRSWSSPGPIPRLMSDASLQKQYSDGLSSSIRVDTPTKMSPEREIIFVILKKDPVLGFGFVMVGEDNTGKLDLGIFIASIVPDGPADRDGRIRPGGRLISLNKISLEGVTFTDAAAILQNCPEEVELIVSQSKYSLRAESRSSLVPGGPGSAGLDKGFGSQSTLSGALGSALEKSFGSQSTLCGTEFRPNVEEVEEAMALSTLATPKQGRRLHVPVVRILDPQEVLSRSRSSSVCSLRSGEQLSVELTKASGSLGISVASDRPSYRSCMSKHRHSEGGVMTNMHYGGIYIKSLLPGGAAEQDGRIQTGDILLEVDGFNLRGANHKQAVDCLKRTGEVVSLLLEREFTVALDSPLRRPRPSREFSMETPLTGGAKDYSFVTDDNTKEVVLKKGLSGLGFSFFLSELRSGADWASVVRVKRLFPGQPAQESGQISQGDVILAINGEPVKDLSYQRVLLLLRGAPSEVRLLICRPAPGELADSNTLSPYRSPTRETRSRSLDIRLTEDYSLLLKKPQAVPLPSRAQDKACTLGRVFESPPDSSEGPQPNTQEKSQECPESEAVTEPTPPSAPSSPLASTPTATSSVSPPSSSSRRGSVLGAQVKEEEEGGEGEVAKPTSAVLRLRRGSYIKASDNPMYASGVREEADGSHTYCLMGNGLTILADEEYLTISSTVATPSSATPSSATPSDTPALPRPPSSHTPPLTTHPPTTPPIPPSDTPRTAPTPSTPTPGSAHQPSHTSDTDSAPLRSRTPSQRSLSPAPSPPVYASPKDARPHPYARRQSAPLTKHCRPVVAAPTPLVARTPPATPIVGSILANSPQAPSPIRQAPPPYPQALLTSLQAPPLSPQAPPPYPQALLTSPQGPSPCAQALLTSSPAPPLTLGVTPLSLAEALSPANQPPSPSSSGWREEDTVFNDNDNDEDEDEDEEEEGRRSVVKEFEMSVVLTKSRVSGSFGFTITRSKIDGCYYVQEVLDNPAKSDGRLRAGDRLVVVNGQDVTSVTDEVAMTVLRSSPRRLSMTLGRAVSNLVAPPSADSLNDIVLYKTPTGQLGIKLTGGIGSKWQGIYCLEVVPGSPASEEGTVRPNDKIIYICGKCTLGMTLEDAVKVCENAPRKVKIKVLRDDQPLIPKARWNARRWWRISKSEGTIGENVTKGKMAGEEW